MQINNLWLLFFLLLKANLFSQQIVITGYVKDTEGFCISNAKIKEQSFDLEVISNSDGFFSFKLPEKKIYAFEIFTSGFMLFKKNVPFSKIQNNQLFVLQGKTVKLDEIILTSSNKTLKQSALNSAEPITKINSENLNKNTLRINDILQISSGLKVRKEGAKGNESIYMLNGLSGKAIPIFYNEIPFQYSGYGKIVSNLPTLFTKNISVYKGVTPVELGADALGGAININQYESLGKQEIKGSYELSSFNTQEFAFIFSDNIRKKTTFNLFSSISGSENNYSVGGGNNTSIYIVNDDYKKQYIKVKNFHNGYKNFFTRPSFTFKNKKYSSEVWASYSYLEKEIQHNRYNPEIVVGEANWTDKLISIGGELILNSILNDQAHLVLKTSYTNEKLHLTDISNNIYNWNGQITGKSSTFGEILNYVNNPFDIVYDTNKYYVSSLFNYNINAKNAIWFSITSTLDARTNDNRLTGIKLESPSWFLKNIFSLSHRSKSLNRKFKNNVSIKYYGSNGAISEIDNSTTIFLEKVTTKSHFFGASNALSFKFLKRSVLKTSYEYAARIPDPNEILGNGIFSFPTNNLFPEKSHNLNLGYSYSYRKIILESNLFYRKTKDLIFLSYTDFRYPKYENKSNVLTKGIELSVEYKSFKPLRFLGNITWQDLRYKPENQEKDYYLYNDRLPNTPYLFGNIFTEFIFKNILFKSDKLALNYNVNYTHSYFQLWESQGVASSKNIIPKQCLSKFQVTYSYQKVNFSLGVHNLMNSYVYDNYKNQLPGRSLHLKTSISL